MTNPPVGAILNTSTGDKKGIDTMKTNHVSTHRNYDNLNHAVRCALHDAHNRDGYLRVINCGKAVVILPDTNRAQDCEMPELLKAMGLTKIEGRQPKLCAPAEEERFNVLCTREGSVECVYSMTMNQYNLVNELERQELLWDEIKFLPMGDFQVRKI